MKVRLHSRAQRDLREIRDYILAQYGSATAEKVRKHLKERILRLGREPQPGISSSEPSIRVLSPTRYPYRIYFTNTPDAVVVLHIRHTSRQVPEIDDLL